jgi:hypothetical protein
VFHLDVAYIAMAICSCCKRICFMLQAYVSSISGVLDVCFMLQAYVSSISGVLDVCFMLQAYVSSRCCKSRSECCICLQCLSSVSMCFASVSDVYCKCFSCFRCMLQVFHLDVAKIDLL